MKTLAIFAIALSTAAGSQVALAEAADPNADIPILSSEEVQSLQDGIPKTEVPVEPGAEPDAMPVDEKDEQVPPPPVLANPPVTVPPDMLAPTAEPIAPLEPAPHPEPVAAPELDAEPDPMPDPMPDPASAQLAAPEADTEVSLEGSTGHVEPLPDPAIGVMKATYMAEAEEVRIATQEVMRAAGTYSDTVDGLYGRKTQAGLIGLSVLVFENSDGAERHPLTTAEEISAFMRWLASGAAQPYIN